MVNRPNILYILHLVIPIKKYNIDTFMQLSNDQEVRNDFRDIKYLEILQLFSYIYVNNLGCHIFYPSYKQKYNGQRKKGLN